MEAVNPQKIKLLKLYEILRQHTDEDRPLSTNQLCAMLEAGGITCDRRTLAEDIDILNANGFEVLRRRTRYAMLFYIVNRRFDLAEVKILIDAIQAASFITIEPNLTKCPQLGGHFKYLPLSYNEKVNRQSSSLQVGPHEFLLSKGPRKCRFKSYVTTSPPCTLTLLSTLLTFVSLKEEACAARSLLLPAQDELQAECDRIGHCSVGEAVLINGYI